MSLPVKKHGVHHLTKQDIFIFLNETDDNLLDIVNKRSFAFETFLKNQLYCSRNHEIDYEVIECIIEAIYRICIARDEGRLGNVSNFLNMVTSCEFFLFQDVLNVINECLDRGPIDLALFTSKYIIVLKTIIKYKLNGTQQIIDVAYPALQNVVNAMQNMRVKNYRITKYEYEKLKEIVDEACGISFTSDENEDDFSKFRQLPIMPKDNDVVNCEVTDLPCNKIDGPYKSVDHYLSVHFRLVREDMLRMFRECIANRIDPGGIIKPSAQMYEEVTVNFPPTYKVEGIFYEINIRVLKSVDWSKKNILVPGTIVCLTKDKFNSVTFAIVSRSPESRSKSTEREAEIYVEDTNDVFERGARYLMFETNAYFECNRHVLGAIKELNENSLPLSDFLVYLDFENPEPEYLVNPKLFKDIKYCLHEKCDGQYPPVIEFASERNNAKELVDQRCLIPNKQREESSNGQLEVGNIQKTIPCNCKQFNPLNYSEWPTAEELKLDDQQLKAFQFALTKKAALIQGPPATGKTFMGVKIVKTLLQNLPFTPIVICCHTNHALDQFLEQIFQHTKNVVRIGSQCKSNIIYPQTLKNLVHAYKEYPKYCKSSVLRMDNTMRTSMNHLKMLVPEIFKNKPTWDFDPYLKQTKRVSMKLNMLLETFCMCRDKYLSDSALNEIISGQDQDQLRSGSETNSQFLPASVLEWLCCSRTSRLYEDCNRRFQKLKNLNVIENIPHFKLWSLNTTKRFELFYVWRERCLTTLQKSINGAKTEYKKLKSTYRGKQPDPVCREILQKCHIIGVTTTEAAKYRSLLRLINPKILLIEEATAVLESHMISSLLPSIQHLILIGDHKQLRPIPANNELGELYKLKISMFERLFQNNAPSATLVSQRRMKPCIAELLVQDELYPDLKSYENVYKYEEIQGVKSSVFFLNHNKAESSVSSSASNDYEAIMIAHFAKYLTRMSYTVDVITILSTYTAQVLLIQKYLDEMCLPILVTTVDNYQGEENDIVLVSFVRSNGSSRMGYLKEVNRMCVALSRARKGLFCFGNFSSYIAQSVLWENTIIKLEAQDMFGLSLPLMCVTHKNEILIESPEAIQNVLSKGCNTACGFRMPCGHLCLKKCHYDDQDHIQHQCHSPCEKYITNTKKCIRKCFEPCRTKEPIVNLGCGHTAKFKKDGTLNTSCMERVTKMLPCNHEAQLLCSTDILTYKCREIVLVKLFCSHQTSVECHKSNNLKHICNHLTPSDSPCGHTVHTPCSLNLDPLELQSLCTHSCDQLLTCGHNCTGSCRSCSDVGIHTFCTQKCPKRLECGHICRGFCGSPCLPCKEKCLLTCSHNTKCINSCRLPCNVCKRKCGRKCSHCVCINKCFEPCSVPACQVPCNLKLPCSHFCIGLCGDPCPELCRICDEDDLTELTTGNAESDRYVRLDDCGHVIEDTTLKEHIDLCLDCFMWPDCPECKAPIQRSLRHKEKLLKAKEHVILSSDHSKEIGHVQYLLNSAFTSDANIPDEFRDVYQKIAAILQRDKPTSGPLLVLQHCLTFLMDLMRVNEELERMECSDWSMDLKSRFDILFSWIGNHLTCASFQQLEEVSKAVVKLQRNII